MIDQIIKQHQDYFTKVLDHFYHELASIRTGRANAGLLSTVVVESYGAKMPLEHVANVTVSDARTLVISPWDKGQLQAVEKGIQLANLGFNPSNDGNVIRVTVPALNEERRREMVKLVGQIAEQSRIGIRQVREDIMKAIKKAENDGHVSKDDVAGGQKKVQAIIDEYNEKIKQTTTDKEKEIMTV